MYNRVNYIVVGLFVLLFTAGMIWFVFWLAKLDMRDEEALYKMYFRESVIGLEKDSSVKLHGVNVGRVVEITIDPNDIERVKVLVKIRKDVPIKEDMVAHLEPLGVTGLVTIVIEGGSNSAKTLKPTKDYIPEIKTAPSWLDKTKKGLEALTQNLNQLLQRSAILFSEKNMKNISRVLENGVVLTDKAEVLEDKAILLFDESRKSLIAIREEIKVFKNKLNIPLEDFHQLTQTSIPMLNKLKQTAANLNRLTRKVEKGVDRGDYNLKKIFEPLIIDTRRLSNEMDDLIRQIEINPSDFLFKSRKPRKGPGE